MSSLVDAGNGGADLGGVAHAEGCHHAKGTEESTQPGPLFTQTVFDVIHRPAPEASLAVRFPVPDGQDHLCIFDYHAQESCHPHPENGAGSTNGNGPCYTGNVAGAYGCSQSGAYGLEG